MTDLFALALAASLAGSGLGCYLYFLATRQKTIIRRLNALEKKNV